MNLKKYQNDHSYTRLIKVLGIQLQADSYNSATKDDSLMPKSDQYFSEGIIDSDLGVIDLLFAIYLERKDAPAIVKTKANRA